MNDFELLIYLLIWSFLLWIIFTAIKTGAIEKILKNFVNEIDPDIQKVTRCEKCKYYNDKVNMCFLHFVQQDDEGFAFTSMPEDYCVWAERRYAE